jgi:hypothetical protein
VIHVATAHYGTPKWIDVQLQYFARNLREPYRVWAAIEGFDASGAEGVDVVVPAHGSHREKLNLLSGHILADAQRDDLIMFVDDDAIPVADPMPLVRDALERSALVAVRRDGQRNPNPIFCAATIGTWSDINGDWARGHLWTTEGGGEITNTGSNLLYLLESRQLEWTPLTRSNRVDLHPLWYGLYGDVVYHHGVEVGEAARAGQTAGETSLLRSRLRSSPAATRVADAIVPRRRRQLRRARQQELLSERIFQEIRTNPRFYERFL